MATDTENQTAAAEAPATIAAAIADTTEKVVKDGATAAKRERAKIQRRVKRETTAAKAAAGRRASKARRTINKAARKPAAATKEGIEMKKTNFPQFDAIPAFTPFQTLFADASERGQDMAKKSQKVAEELADLTRANVEAMVEAGRVAAEGARTIGQDFVATGRDGAEKAADAIRSLAEAKSPTEYMQLQGDFARASFDRMVAESSRLTESFVKLAGEAFQPLQNRASANAERFNTLVA